MNCKIKVIEKIQFINIIAIVTILILNVILAYKFTPSHFANLTIPDFESLIPASFDGWTVDNISLNQAGLTSDKNDLVNQIYDRVLMRTYKNNKGEKVMLAIAYAHEQRQDIKIHLPEVCYIAQGFKLLSQSSSEINWSEKPKIPLKRLTMQYEDRLESVSYFVRVGSNYPMSGLKSRYIILKEGLKGNILDGVLVRVSIQTNNPEELNSNFNKQENFLKSLLHTIPERSKNILIAI